MNGSRAPAAPASPPRDRRGLWAALLLVAAAGAAWYPGFSGAFVFDDLPTIVANPSVRHPESLGALLNAGRAGLTSSGRPLVHLTLVANYALSGTGVWSYHAFNLAIHLLAGLTLFGIVRRTLLTPVGAQACCARTLQRSDCSNSPDQPHLLALAVALLWTLHPLQTESVTYIVQRAESLMGLLCLATLYCFLRSVDSPRPRRWQTAAVAACFLGAAAKESMVIAPLLVLLYDRTFVAGGLRAAWRQHRGLHLALAGSWLLVGWLVLQAGGRGDTAGLGTSVPPAAYALTQAHAIVHYVRLALWPHPLVFDYGTALVGGPAAVWPQLLAIAALVAATAWAWRRAPAVGFLGCWFLLTLAPSSSFVPVASQTMAEHRMYLPLAAIVVFLVMAFHFFVRRPAYTLTLIFTLAVGLGWLTAQRNADYRSARGLWRDTVAKCPANVRARNNLGNALYREGQIPAAVAQYEQARQLQPSSAEAHLNLANALVTLGRPAEALAEADAALRLRPDSADARVLRGNALTRLGRSAEAMQQYEAALQIQPDAADAQISLGFLLAQAGRMEEAIRWFLSALRLHPEQAMAHFGLASALEKKGEAAAAIEHHATALRLQPDLVEAAFALGNLQAAAGRFPAAAEAYRQALRYDPGNAPALANLGNALLVTGRVAEAIVAYEEALRLRPDDAAVRANLEEARALQRAPGRAP
jgi:tetratricopeptide (TPR) repeat protein